MASPDEKDEAEKYKDLSEEELRKECEKRNLDLSGVFSKEDLIELLLADDNKPTDWAQIYARLLDVGLNYEEIPKRTLPQIKALLGEWADLIALKIPNIFGGITEAAPSKEESRQEDVDEFFSSF